MIVFFYCGVEHGGKERQVFLYCQILIQGKPPRHITDVLSYLLIIIHHVHAIDHSFAGICKEQGCENTEQGGLAGSVRAYQPEYFTFFDIEGHSFQSFNPSFVVGHFKVFYTYYCHNRIDL